MRSKSSAQSTFARKSLLCLSLGLTSLSWLSCQPGALARNMWDVNHGMSNPPVEPGMTTPAQSGQSHSGSGQASGINQGKPFDPGFWQHLMDNTIPSGTVLSAILEHDLSSAKNRQGDIFALTLQDGFQLNGKVLIPPMSKIIGSVNAVTPAASISGGHPGRLQISLQSVVFPDGRHLPLSAFIDGNPNQGSLKAPKVQPLGESIMQYGSRLTAMGRSFISGPGFMMAKFNRGQDFKVHGGEVLPIRLTQDLEIPPEERLIAQPSWAHGGGANGVPMSPGMPVTTPGMLDPSGPIRIPGFVPGTMPGASSQAQGGQDPNAIFNQPISPGRTNNRPDPF